MEKTALVPESERPYPIPENWVWTRLASVFDEVKEKTIPTAESELFFIGLEHLQSGGGIVGVGESKDVKSTKTVFNADDVLYGKLRPYLNKHSRVDFAGVASTDILVFRPKGIFDSRLLDNYLGLSHVIAYAQRHSKGINLPRVSPQVINNLPVPLPPLPEQHRIAEKLESLLGKIKEAKSLLDEIPEILQNFRQTVLAAACSGRLTQDWRRNRTFSKTVKVIVNEIRNRRTKDAKSESEKKKLVDIYSFREEHSSMELPNTWGVVALDKLCESFSYGTSTKSSPSGKVTVLRMGNIQNGKLDWTNLAYTSDEKEIHKYKLKHGDVLFNRTNSPELVGKTAIYRGEQPAIYAGYLIKINNYEELNSEYLNYCLNTAYAKEYCMQVKSDGVNQSNINAQKLGKFEIPFCPIEEQEEIVRLVDSLFSKADDLEAQYKDAMELIESLPEIILSKAFRGKLVPQNPSDEPASVLLQRILSTRERQDEKRPKPKKAERKPMPTKITRDALKEIIGNLPSDLFTFDDLRGKVSADYETIKDLFFELLSERPASVRQVFDKKAQNMRFERINL